MTVKPSEKEEEYFARLELERRKKEDEEILKKRAEEDRARLKALHFMRCPKCGMELKEVEHKGITIDKCFSCDGVWLDAGELDAVAQLDKTALDKLFSVFKR